MRTGLLLLGVAALLGQPACARAQDQQAAHGRALFMQDGCYECHGMVGQGGSAGPRLVAPAVSAALIERYVRAPAGVMPPYSAKVLPDGDVSAIAAYLASLPKPPPVSQIPELRRQ